MRESYSPASMQQLAHAEPGAVAAASSRSLPAHLQQWELVVQVGTQDFSFRPYKPSQGPNELNLQQLPQQKAPQRHHIRWDDDDEDEDEGMGSLSGIAGVQLVDEDAASLVCLLPAQVQRCLLPFLFSGLPLPLPATTAGAGAGGSSASSGAGQPGRSASSSSPPSAVMELAVDEGREVLVRLRNNTTVRLPVKVRGQG